MKILLIIGGIMLFFYIWGALMAKKGKVGDSANILYTIFRFIYYGVGILFFAVMITSIL